MANARDKRFEFLAARKQEVVERDGCDHCRCGKVPGGFERYWEDYDQYVARRFVFKYTEPLESDVPVSQIARHKNGTPEIINEAISRCVILCRTCADPRTHARR